MQQGHVIEHQSSVGGRFSDLEWRERKLDEDTGDALDIQHFRCLYDNHSMVHTHHSLAKKVYRN